MEDKIKDIFSKNFQDHSESVRPELWSGVQGKLLAANSVASGAAAVKTSLGIWKTVFIAGGFTSAAIISTAILFNNKKDTSKVVPAIELTQKSKSVSKALNSNDVVFSSLKENSKMITLPNILDTPLLVADSTNSSGGTYNSLEKDEKIRHETPTPPKLPGLESKEPKMENGGIYESQQKISEMKQEVILEAKVSLFPNVFSPNEDGINDEYIVQLVNVSNYQMSIMDQNNKIVFSSNDILVWNGNLMNGEKATQGMYACVIIGKDPQGKLFKDIQLFELK